MKTVFLFSIYLCYCLPIFAQAPIIEWEKSLGGTDNESVRKIQPTKDGGVIMAGYTFSNDGHVTQNKGIYDAWLIKLRPDRSIEWQKTLGGSTEDAAYDIEQTADGGFIMCGFTQSKDGDIPQQKGTSDAWLVKTDAAGNIQWNKTYGGSDFEVLSSIKQTPDGGYIAAGYSISGNGDITQPVKSGKQDWWLIKLDPNGNKIWDKSYGGSNDEVAYAMSLVPGGGYILTGTTSSNDGHVNGGVKGNYDIWTVRISDDGTLLWQKTFGGSAYDKSSGVTPTSDGGFLVAGGTQSTNGDIAGNEGEMDAVLIKYHANGTLLWHRTLGGNKFDDFHAVREINGKYVVVGGTESTIGSIQTKYGANDILLAQYSTTGTLEWTALYGGSLLDDAFDLKPTNDGGLLVAGSSFSTDQDVKNSFGGGDMWLVKLKSINPLPVISKQPDNIVQCMGSTASFSIAVTLADSYQWQILNNGAWQNIIDQNQYSGGNTAKLTITNTQTTDAAQYRCTLKNAGGETVSNIATLTIQKMPTISITPIGSIICAGIALTLTSKATDADRYIWQKQNGNLWQDIGDENPNYVITAGKLTDAGDYRCVAENTCGSKASNTTNLEVVQCLIPIIATQPADASVCESGIANMEITAHRVDRYQWQILKNGVWHNLTNDNKYTGTATQKLVINDCTQNEAEQYRCVLNNMFGETISDAAKLAINYPPEINITTANSTACIGSIVNLLASATKTDKLNWQKKVGNNWQNTSASGKTFSFTALATNAGQYRCVSENQCGTTISNSIILQAIDCNIPNAFSPNGDGINDKWAIYFLQSQPESIVRIFDRYGTAVFESQPGYPLFWDGTQRDKALPTGVYYYIISSNSIGKIQGAVTLLR